MRIINLGYGVSQDYYRAGDIASVTLFWQARATTQTSYTISLHIQDANGRLLVQSDALPVNGARPTTDWKPDEVIEDRREINLPSILAPGQYILTVGVYDANTGTRLDTSDGKNELTLMTLEIR